MDEFKEPSKGIQQQLQEDLVRQQSLIISLLKASQQQSDQSSEMRVMGMLAQGLSIVAAFIGGAVLSVVLSPPELLFAPESWAQFGACVKGGNEDYCLNWKHAYGIASVLSLALLSFSLLLSIPAGMGQFHEYFTLAVVCFSWGLVSVAVAVVAASWLLTTQNVAIFTTIVMCSFVFYSIYVLLPWMALSFFHIFRERDPIYSASSLHWVISKRCLTPRMRLAAVKIVLVANRHLINSGDDAGATALHIAAARGNKMIVGLLLENGANRLITDNEGKTALDVARELQHGAVERLLEKTD